MSKTSVLLVGGGRMGARIQELLEQDGGFEILGVYDIDNIDELDERAVSADLVIDFSAPAALTHICAYVKRTNAALVSGTTGLNEQELAQIKALGETSKVIHAANYSLGVAVMRKLASLAATSLPEFDIEIVETHHNQKADAPSGTAKALLDAVDPSHSATVINGREGIVGARRQAEIGMHALRGGSVAGVHTIHFFGQDEELSITHTATSRTIFAVGAVTAAKRLLMLPTCGYVSFDELMFG